MKRIDQVLQVSMVIAGVIALSILSIPILLVAWPVNFLQQKQFDNRYRAYLKMLEGKNFLCYNNRKKSMEYIHNELIPILPENVEVIYLNGKVPQSHYESKYISYALYSLKHYSKFPHLMKVRNGEVIDCSINQDLHHVIDHQKSMDSLLGVINEFFDLNRQ
ncbi:MAG: hypothetical protein V4714_20060 [Bacteroidota bacterium]